MAMATLKLTPTQKKFYDLMADGERHRIPEFRMVMNDDLATEAAIAVRISSLRAILKGIGEDVVCERAENRQKTYRRVRTLYTQGE